MPPRVPSTWLPWLLFRLTLSVAGALLAAVVLAPLLDACGPASASDIRLVALFAHDATVRRTALASAVGLAVTACVFFQRQETPSHRPGTKPLPRDNVGA